MGNAFGKVNMDRCFIVNLIEISNYNNMINKLFVRLDIR